MTTKTLCLALLALIIALRPCSAQRDSWESSFTEGKKAFAERRYDEAEKYYRAALAQAEKGEDSKALAATSLALGTAYYAERRFEQAEPLLERAVSLREKEKPADPNALASAHLQLAELFRATDRFDRALSLYDKGAAETSDPVTLATVHLDRGFLYSAQTKTREAEHEFLLAVSGFPKSTSKARMGLGICYLALGHIYETGGRLAEAATKYQQAISAFEQVANPNSSDVLNARESYSRITEKLRHSAANRDNDHNDLEDTMSAIQRELNAIGPVTYVAYAHDSETGHDWKNTAKDEVSQLVANSLACHIYYHWFTGTDQKVFMDKEVGFALRDIQTIEVLTRKQVFDDDNASGGHPTWIVTVDPPLFVVIARRPAGVSNHFVFRERDAADHLAEELSKAVSLCGGHLSQ